MSMTSYMKIQGKTQGEIQGDCTQQGRENMILCYSLNHSVEIPKDTHTGLPTGQRIHHTFKVVTNMGKHTPKLFQACCTGESLDVEMHLYHINEKGQEEKYFQIKMQNAIVVESREWYPETFLEKNKPYKHMQDISFTYETIIWTDVVNGIEAEDSWKKPKSG
jgi:type VI secretion system secreted protein Hcp